MKNPIIARAVSALVSIFSLDHLSSPVVHLSRHPNMPSRVPPAMATASETS